MYQTGTIYVTAPNNDAIRVVTSAGTVTTLSDTVPLSYGIWFDISNNLYVTSGSTFIYYRASAGGSFSLYAGGSSYGYADGIGTNAMFHDPRGLSGDTQGTMYVADYNNFRIRKIDLATATVSLFAGTGSSGDGGDALSAGLGKANAVTVDTTSGIVYVADYTNALIRLLPPIFFSTLVN